MDDTFDMESSILKKQSDEGAQSLLLDEEYRKWKEMTEWVFTRAKVVTGVRREASNMTEVEQKQMYE
jgi:hypothetical protein